MGMRDRLLSGFLLLLFSVFPAFGQGGFTTVSGAIVDPNGIPWTGGTISAQLITQGGTAPTLNGQPFSSTTASGLLGPGGTFTMRLGDNGVIVPSTTTWQFTISIAPGVLPPLGKGPQSFTVTTAINCGTNTPATCTSNAITITSVLTPVPALSFVSTGLSTLTPTIFNPSSSGAKGGVKWTTSAIFSNASQHVTCNAGDCGFLTTAKVGQIVLCTTFSAYVNGAAFTQALLCPYGTTITAVNSNTDVTISATPTSSCTASISIACGFAWGTQDDSAALNAAALAAWGTPGLCGQLQLTDNYFFSSAIFNQTIAQLSSACGGQFGGANVSGIDSTQEGPTLIGSGPGSGVLIPYNFNFGSCISTANCLLTVPNLFVDKIGINGLGQPATGASAGQQLVTMTASTGGGSCTGSTLTNSGFANWGVNQNIVGLTLGNGCAGPTYANNIVEMFGGTACSFGASGANINANYFYNMCFGSTIQTVLLQGGGILNLESNFFGGEIGNGPILAYTNSGGGTVNSRSNVYWFAFGLSSSSAQVLFFNGSGTLHWNSDGDDINLGSGTTGTSNAVNMNSSGPVIFHMRNTTITATGTNNRTFNLAAGNSLYDDGGNIISNGTLANVLNGSLFGITNSALNAVCATGNFALTSGWGASSVTSVAANGNIQGCHVTIAGAAGAASPVLTWTYPTTPPLTAPGSCHLSGASGTLTGVSTGTPGATTVAYTFTGTPSAQTYIFDVGCP
jgi:hypothetical protein